MADDPKVRRLREVQAELIALGHGSAFTMKQHHLRLQNLAKKWDLDAESKKAGAKIEWDKFATETARVADVNRQLREEHAKLLTELTASHRQPGGAHEEMQRQAAWSRLEKTLDTLDPRTVKFAAADQLLQAAEKVGDMPTLEAARRELPAYLARHNEPVPPPMQVWLDTNAGPPETRAARTFQMLDEQDLWAADFNVKSQELAVTRRELPGVFARPGAPEGKRVDFLSDEHEQAATR